MKNMFLMALLGLASIATFTSCLEDNDDGHDKCYYPGSGQAIVTVKPKDADGSFYMQLNDSVRFYPRNVKTSPYGQKEVRAFILFDDPRSRANSLDCDVSILQMDSILTKPCAKNLGDQNASAYGDDPVTISGGDWMTIAEDGYLTLRFMTAFGGGKKHLVNLVTGANPNDPYEVRFYHNAFGDVDGHPSYGIVAFKLGDLPDTNGKTVDLTLRWKSYDGERKMTMKYCTRKSTGSDDALLSSTDYTEMME